VSEDDEVEDEPGQDSFPWDSFLPRSLSEQARAAVSSAPEAVRAMVESTIAASLLTRDEGFTLQEWLGWVAALPWGKPARIESVDMVRAARILDEAHRGDDAVKAQILDRVMASWILAESNTGHRTRPLLLVGPPGTGKSTLARATAEAMGLHCAFISVATAVHDSVYLLGCARAYRSAEPGAIIQAVRAAGSRRLIFVLDELDKVPSGSATDSPSAAPALLTMLDGHARFLDRYLGVEVDLSPALWVATANSLEPIPEPLLDRCDVVTLPGLSPGQRLDAARSRLWPRLIRDYQLPNSLIPMDQDALRCLVFDYAAPGEEGLRAVEGRLEACLMRAVRRGFDGVWPVPVTRSLITECLGPVPDRPRPPESKPDQRIGFAVPHPPDIRGGAGPDRGSPGHRLEGLS
jgi:ATP-dependent Lon protease